jgi:hypothetical protein
MLAERTRVDRCEVLRQDLIKDRGVYVPRDPDNPWPEIAENVRVRIEPLQAMPRDVAGGPAVTTEGAFVAKFDIGEDIQNLDRIRVTTDGNRVFQMIARRDGTSKTSVVFACQEII